MPEASPDEASAVSQRRLRNRLSQQAFRKRQSAYIKDLERRLEIKSNDRNDQIAQLEKDNRALRAQLTTTCAKLERIQNTLKSLSASMMSHISHGSDTGIPTPQDSLRRTSLDMEDGGDMTTVMTAAAPTTTTEAANQGQTHADASLGTAPDTNEAPRQDDEDAGTFFPQLETLPTEDHEGGDLVVEHHDVLTTGLPEPDAQDSLSLEMAAILDSFSGIQELPGIWSHSYQMGPASFQARSPSVEKTTRALANSNSSFSDHLQMIRTSLVKRWQKANRVQSKISAPDGIRLSSTIMLSLFHSLTRPAALTWYTATRFQENITNLLLWQMHHSRTIYSRLHASYRPSALQLYEQYPSIIDWCPFPTIRDKLILLHSANPYLDQIICDIATSYVVQVDMAKLVLGRMGQGYIRIWDLVCAFETDESDNDDADPISMAELTPTPVLPNDHLSLLLPAPDIESLFEPKCSREVFKVLGLDDGTPRFKLDPSLFIQYPELYDPGAADIMATGPALAPKVQTKLPCPTLPKQETLKIYRNVADWSVNAICNGSLT